MNSSAHASNVSTSLSYRDSSSTAVIKNVIVVALGLTINYINGTLIHTFRKHQVFYVNPRYILFIHMVVNDMIQLTTTISLFVFSYVFYKIHASICCFLIIFAIFTTFNTPLNLAAMAIECYIAVCFPLRHAELVTIRSTYILIGWIWVMAAVTTLPDVFITLATEPVRLFHSTIFCVRNNLFRHPVSLTMRDVACTVCLICVWLTLIFIYVKIFFAAQSAKAAKPAGGDAKKARNTILLHGFQLLLCMLTYMSSKIKKGLVSWFPQHYVQVLFVCYIIIQILPRLISPIVYGLRDKTFKVYLKTYLLCTMRADSSKVRTALDIRLHQIKEHDFSV